MINIILEWGGWGDDLQFEALRCALQVQLYGFSIPINRHPCEHLAYKVNSNGTDKGLCISVVCETKQQARLANSRVPNQQELEQIVTKHKNLKDTIKDSCLLFLTHPACTMPNRRRVNND